MPTETSIERLLHYAMIVSMAYLVVFGANYVLPLSVLGPYLLALLIGALLLPRLAVDHPSRATEIVLGGQAVFVWFGVLLSNFGGFDLAATAFAAIILSVLARSIQVLALTAVLVAIGSGALMTWEADLPGYVVGVRSAALMMITVFFGHMIARLRLRWERGIAYSAGRIMAGVPGSSLDAKHPATRPATPH